jgi:hypothetical protein
MVIGSPALGRTNVRASPKTPGFGWLDVVAEGVAGVAARVTLAESSRSAAQDFIDESYAYYDQKARAIHALLSCR